MPSDTRTLHHAGEKGRALLVGIRLRLHTLLLRETLPLLPQFSAWVRARFGERLSVGLLRPKPLFDWASSAPTWRYALRRLRWVTTRSPWR